MTVLDRNPTNPNLLQSNKFEVMIARLPGLQYFCQDVIIPGAMVGEIPRDNPFITLWSPSDKMEVDPLVMTFLLDEELQAYREIYDWIKAMTFPEDFEQYMDFSNFNPRAMLGSRKGFEQFSDITVFLLTGTKLPNYKFTFYDAFPTSLTPFSMSTRHDPDQVTLTTDVSFRYSYFKIEKMSP